MTIGILVFLFLGIVAVAAAVGMILSRNTVYSALFLVLNFLTVAVVFLLMGAPFISFAQISVYAGAIMILFLFVIMLLGTEKITTPDPVPWQRPLVIILAAAVVIEGAYVLITRYGTQAAASLTAAEIADPAKIGTLLYTKFSLPFEVTSIILLVAAIGAVVLARPKVKDGGNQ